MPWALIRTGRGLRTAILFPKLSPTLKSFLTEKVSFPFFFIKEALLHLISSSAMIMQRGCNKNVADILLLKFAQCFGRKVKYISLLMPPVLTKPFLSLRATAYSFVYVCASANHPYSQPEGWIAKGTAQRDRPNAYERRLWLPPNGHEWSRSTAAMPDVFLTWIKARPQHRELHALLLTNSVWVL